MRVRGEDGEQDVLPVGRNRPSCPRVGGRHIHRRRRVPGVLEDFNRKRDRRQRGRGRKRRPPCSIIKKTLTRPVSVAIYFYFLRTLSNKI